MRQAIAEIDVLSLIKQSLGTGSGADGANASNESIVLNASTFVAASEAVSELIEKYASDPTEVLETSAVSNETIAVRKELKLQVQSIGRALGVTQETGAPATCVSAAALDVCAERRSADAVGGNSSEPYTLRVNARRRRLTEEGGGEGYDEEAEAHDIRAWMKTPANEIPGVDASKPVEAVLFTSPLDLQGKASQKDSLRAGASVSFLLTQEGEELAVQGLKEPFQLTVPLEDADELQRSCVGQPDKASLLERLLSDGTSCESSLECRYWDEELDAWSTEGCYTRVYTGSSGEAGFVGCECTHLSDFVAVKVPTRAYGEIRFGSINADNLVTTNVQCTQGGLWLTLSKRDGSAPTLLSELRVASPVEERAPLSWELLNLTCPHTAAIAEGGVAAVAEAGAGVEEPSCAWVRALNLTGNTSQPIMLEAAGVGLAEGTAADAYVATAALRLFYRDGANKELLVPIHAAVYAQAHAPRSVLGARCGAGNESTLASPSSALEELTLGTVHVQSVSLCDFEGLPVDHELPRDAAAADTRELTAAFRAAAFVGLEPSDALPASPPPPNLPAAPAPPWQPVAVEYAGGAQYTVRLSPPRLGKWEVAVRLGDEVVGDSLRLHVVCPVGLVPWPDGLGCGCPAGQFDEHQTDGRAPDGTHLCKPCLPGYSSVVGTAADPSPPCEPCPAGHTSTRPPSDICVPCAAGRFAAEEGAERCDLCATGTHSTVGAASCTFCSQGYFLERAKQLDPFSTSSCTACPKVLVDGALVDGAVCAPNSTTASLVLKPGFWRLSEQTAHLYACARQGDDSSCAGGAAVSDASCASGRAGPLCEWCLDEQKYWNEEAARCTDCPEPGERLGWAIAVVTLGVASLLLARKMVLKEARDRQGKMRKPARKLVRFGRRMQHVARVFSVVPKCKIAFGTPTGQDSNQGVTWRVARATANLTAGVVLWRRRLLPGSDEPRAHIRRDDARHLHGLDLLPRLDVAA